MEVEADTANKREDKLLHQIYGLKAIEIELNVEIR